MKNIEFGTTDGEWTIEVCAQDDYLLNDSAELGIALHRKTFTDAEAGWQTDWEFVRFITADQIVEAFLPIKPSPPVSDAF